MLLTSTALAMLSFLAGPWQCHLQWLQLQCYFWQYALQRYCCVKLAIRKRGRRRLCHQFDCCMLRVPMPPSAAPIATQLLAIRTSMVFCVSLAIRKRGRRRLCHQFDCCMLLQNFGILVPRTHFISRGRMHHAIRRCQLPSTMANRRI